MRSAVGCVLLATLLACAAAPRAAAHGDPGSEYLAGHALYLPFDLKAPRADEQRLLELVDEANRAGFAVRVAVVWSRRDLGIRTVYWGKPQAYARYLAADLRDAYRSRLLVVMPAGFGFARLGDASASERATLSAIAVRPGPAGLTDSSLSAVRALAEGSGVKLAATRAPSSSRNRDRAIIVIAAAAAAMLVRAGLRRRH